MRFQHDVGPEGAIYAGSPETVAHKIADTVRTLGARALRHEVLDRHALAREDDAAIELYGTQVAPLVRNCSPSAATRPGIRTMTP